MGFIFNVGALFISKGAIGVGIGVGDRDIVIIRLRIIIRRIILHFNVVDNIESFM